MSRVHLAAARMMRVSFKADSHPATWVSAAGGAGVAVDVQMERAGPEDAMLASTPMRSERINAAVLAGAVPAGLSLYDTLTFPAGSPFAGLWRVDSVPRTRGEDDPAGLLVRFEAVPEGPLS
jgi:hypothetical protein